MSVFHRLCVVLGSHHPTNRIVYILLYTRRLFADAQLAAELEVTVQASDCLGAVEAVTGHLDACGADGETLTRLLLRSHKVPKDGEAAKALLESVRADCDWLLE
jgi:hypothetical protein